MAALCSVYFICGYNHFWYVKFFDFLKLKVSGQFRRAIPWFQSYVYSKQLWPSGGYFVLDAVLTPSSLGGTIHFVAIHLKGDLGPIQDPR